MKLIKTILLFLVIYVFNYQTIFSQKSTSGFIQFEDGHKQKFYDIGRIRGGWDSDGGQVYVGASLFEVTNGRKYVNGKINLPYNGTKRTIAFKDLKYLRIVTWRMVRDQSLAGSIEVATKKGIKFMVEDVLAYQIYKLVIHDELSGELQELAPMFFVSNKGKLKIRAIYFD